MKNYSVSIYATPMSFPLSFTVHTWIEISDGETTDRYDLWGYPGLPSPSPNRGYVYHNLLPDHLGTTFSPFAKASTLKGRQAGKQVRHITGEAGSPAEAAYRTIKEKAFDYPAAHTYRMIWGPNCNTYTQWLIDQTQNTVLTLPWNAWGKGTVA